MASPAIAHGTTSIELPPRKRFDALGRRFVRFWEEQEKLDGIAEKLTGFVRTNSQKLPGGQKTVDFLNGTFIGHPLHPILTDLPIGAFTFAMMFDLATIGRKEPSRAATTLLAVGLASVPITALAGVLDWQHTNGKTKRVGLGHALMNSTGSLFLGASLATRLSGSGPTRTLNFLGNGILMLSAYLGGHLVFDSKVGQKYESEAGAPEHYVPVLPESELKEQTLVRGEYNSYPVALYKRFGTIYAVGDVCPHYSCALSEGSVEADAIICGCHGSRFSLADGSVLQGPSAFPVDAYTARIVNGMVEVAPMKDVNR
jgi:nitrite reductase/ring-hydroxylating ferredoxin subunit/uncharacterized membrane protein